MNSKLQGTRIPKLAIRTRRGTDWTEIDTEELFANKTVVVFALPGAFTPTCSSAHVPRYNELVDAFTAAGVDEIVCISVNDAFVMQAWQKDQAADRLTFLPDGNGALSNALGMLVSKTDLGFGKRSWRYSMLVENGVVTKAFVETERPGDPFDVSDADTMLAHLGGSAPPDVVVFTKPGCGHCGRAKTALAARGIPFSEVPASPRMLRALPGEATTPVVFIDGAHVGGAEELDIWLAKANSIAS